MEQLNNFIVQNIGIITVVGLVLTFCYFLFNQFSNSKRNNKVDKKDVISDKHNDIKSFKSETDSKIEIIQKDIAKLKSSRNNLLHAKLFNLDFSEMKKNEKNFISDEYKIRNGNAKKDQIDRYIIGLQHLIDTNYDDAIIEFTKASTGANDKERAEYLNYKGLAYDKKYDFINAIECYAKSIDALKYEKPFYNMACSFAGIYKELKLIGDVKYQNYKEKFLKIDKAITFIIKKEFDNIEDLMNYCSKKALEVLEVSIEKRNSNVTIAINSDPKNELLIFFEDESTKGDFEDMILSQLKKYHKCIKTDPLIDLTRKTSMSN